MIIGITGSIASGKTFVTDYLKELGYKIIDADEISRNLLKKNSEGYFKVIEVFSKDILTDNEEIDRKKLAMMIFNNSINKKKLEEIVHPLVFEEIEKYKEKYKEDKYIFISMPLLFETGYQNKVDKVITVYIKKDIQVERLMKRDDIDKEYAITKISSQFDLEEKVKNSDYIIDNETSDSGVYDNYNGPILPMTILNDINTIPAKRNINFKFSSDNSELGINCLVSDNYSLTNQQDSDVSVDFAYPLIENFKTVALPIIRLDGKEINFELLCGGYTGEFRGTHVNNNGSLNLKYYNSWVDYKNLLQL